jgi:hypothetical protein
MAADSPARRLLVEALGIPQAFGGLVRIWDWLAALAGLLVAGGAVATLYYETGYTYCFEPEGSGPLCRTVAVADPLPVWLMTVIVGLVGLVAGCLFFRYRVRAFLIIFGLATGIVWFGTLGVAWPFLPAGIVSLVAGLWPRGARPAR